MLQVKSPILYFFLLILGILLNLGLDADYKQNRFSKTLLKKYFKFVLSKRNSTVAFDLDLVLLPAKIDSVVEKQNCKKYALRIRGIGCIEIILALLIKIVVFYIDIPVIQVVILGLEDSISKSKIRLAILLALNKQF